MNSGRNEKIMQELVLLWKEKPNLSFFQFITDLHQQFTGESRNPQENYLSKQEDVQFEHFLKDLLSEHKIEIKNSIQYNSITCNDSWTVTDSGGNHNYLSGSVRKPIPYE